MDRIRNLKLRNSLFLYLVIFLSLGIFLSVFTQNICNKVEETIWLDNLDDIDEFAEFQDEYNFQFQEFLPIPSSSMDKLSIKERIIIEVCDFLETWCWFLFAFGGALVAVIIFYNKKLKQPITLLQKGAQEIGKTNLDFEISYDKKDEMGELCKAFEQMRVQLIENNSYLWNMIEEQKQLRSAFTHDIRTPLSVLKGYVQLLKRHLPEQNIDMKKQLEILDDIEEQAVRLERFSDSIKKTQKMDNLSITKEPIAIGTLLDKMEKTILLMKGESSIVVEYKCHCSEIEQLYIDMYIFMEVVENIVANALRYAKNKIDMYIQGNCSYLTIMIIDDGKGFSEQDIMQACRPYYHEQLEEEVLHYGLGLYICKVLCEKHGGSIELSNSENEGACVQAVFNIDK
ncbi:HAMP domain-containing histidine kinase [bacterium]|uniref:HAMP domain-containing sensor histidine kinase n=1 Tax=Agathobacter rectalis TaxID=39491 RepID=UPI0018A01299|nr:HAMP domain-containing sensor histidine kinase [Agathobacter rectalis]MCB6950241.1 HAMP domain-containing histidine kinase [Agathobacter rectalis]MCI6044567.1 HAMP domain-containing histidine kinase [bacterium]MDY3022557.1 HAMP domain-containing sensor histidine kinase [Oliverpabstia sp.]MDY3999608.1 HAMP domain-containing sensor histidine kinase [Blautia sp.]